MNWFADLFFRATLSEIEYQAWLQSEAGRIVRNRTAAQRLAHFFMWPVYFFEGLIGLVLEFFPGRNGQAARLPSDFMLGHRATPVIYMSQKQLARAVIGAEGRQCFWLVNLIIATMIAIVLGLVVIAKTGGEIPVLIFAFIVLASVLGGAYAGVAHCFYNARENMVRFKRMAATHFAESQAHGQAQIVPLSDEDGYV